MATDDEIHQLQRKYDVSPTLAQLLHMLATNHRITAAQVEDAGIVGDARVSIHRLRKVLAPNNITVRSSYRTGYWMSDEDRATVLSSLKVAA